MSRPVDWDVVGLSADPTPGDGVGVRAVAGVYGSTASAASQTRQLVAAVQSASGTGVWFGESGDAFREVMDGFPSDIQACESSYETARDAMNWWAGRLEDHQGSADRGLEQARAADADLQAARVALDQALASAQTASSALTDLENDAIRYRTVEPPAGKSVPDAGDVAAARRASAAASAAKAAASGRVSDAQSRLDAASRLVADAAAAYEADANNTITKLETAYDQALAENSVWEKIRSSDAWQVLVTVANVVAVVAGFIAIFVGGPFALIVALASLVLLADALLGFATGDGSWLELISAAVAFIPGGALLKVGKGITKLGLKIAPKLTTTITGALAKLASKATTSITTVRNMFTTGSHEGGLVAEEIDIFTGGAITSRPQGYGDEVYNWAEDVYSALRKGDAEETIQAISQNVSEFTEGEIRAAIRNVLIEPHCLDGATGGYFMATFDAEPEMAEAFLRLIKGAHGANDLLLMQHEIAEAAIFAQCSNLPYSVAHMYANTVADWASVMKDLGRI